MSRTGSKDPREEAVCSPLHYLLWVMDTLSFICDDSNQKLYNFTSRHSLPSMASLSLLRTELVFVAAETRHCEEKWLPQVCTHLGLELEARVCVSRPGTPSFICCSLSLHLPFASPCIDDQWEQWGFQPWICFS